MREALAACTAPVIAVSPIIGGRAVKGPTAKMMAELRIPVTASAVATRYADLLDAYVADHADQAEVADLGIPITVAHTLMSTIEDREQLAGCVLAVADSVAGEAA